MMHIMSDVYNEANKDKPKTDREKLIELVNQAKYCASLDDCDGCKWGSEKDCFSARIADHLLFHGVTFEKQGEWIGWGKGGTPTYENYGTCNVCHEDAEIYTEHRNYCPNCGARMKGAVNNE